MWLEFSSRYGQFDPAASSWVLGYLSGAAAGSDIDVLKNVDNPNGIKIWIENYCKDHPLDGVPDAARALFLELVKRTGKKK